MLYNRRMKKKLVYFAMSLSVILATISAPIAAGASSIGGIRRAMADSSISDPSYTGVNRTSTTAANPTNVDDSSKKSTDDAASRAARLESAKKNLKETLTTDQKTRIAERCVAAQAVVQGKLKNNGVASVARITAYDTIMTNLQSIVTTAQTNKVDVSELQREIALLQTKITTFKTVDSTYQQVLTDLGALDCKTDPIAFKAALEAAKTGQTAVFTSAKDIKAYFTGTVKTTLQTLKTQLK
jgi:hypothetical protein